MFKGLEYIKEKPKMKHIKLFEYFEPTGKDIKKTKITISFNSQNPDVKYGAEVMGISENPTHAAIFALASGWNFVLGSEEEIHTIKKSYEILDSIYMDESQYMKQIYDIQSGKIERDIFGDHGTSSEASVNVEITEEDLQEGGKVLSSYG